MILSHNDPRLSWHGHISLERTSDYTRPWRIPFEQRALFFRGLVDKAAEPSGVRLSFRTTARTVSGGILPQDGSRFLDLCVEGRFVARQDLGSQETFVFRNLPEGDKLVELWLPQLGDFALKWIEVEEGANVRPLEDGRKRWITYGSSITHCIGAEAPTQTWPSIVAREVNLNLTNLGVSGQCHLDFLIAKIIRDRPADFLSICAGANACSDSSLNARSFASSLIGFVQAVREKHPVTPLLLISPIFTAETAPNRVGWTMENYREAVAETAEVLRQNGDHHVRYVNGLELFDESLAHLMRDGWHPNADGYKMMGKNFLERAGPILFGRPANN